MIALPQVRFFIWKNPFYWSWFLHTIFLLVLVLPYFLLYSYTFIEKKQIKENFKLFNQRLKNREREILSLKLSALEAYQWQPVLRCQTLSNERANDDNCFLTALVFMPTEQSQKISKPFSFDTKKQTTLTTQNVDTPCLLCHRKEKNKQLVFQHQIIPPSNQTPATDFFYSQSFFWFSMTIIISVLLFHTLRIFLWLHGDLRIVAFAALNREYNENQMLQLSHHLEIESFFLYREAGNGYLRGYASQRKFRIWLKNYFTPNLNKLEKEFSMLRAVAFTTDVSSLSGASAQGILMAQTIAAKPKETAFLLERRLLNGSRLDQAGKQAFWNSKGKKVEFRFLKITENGRKI